MLELRHLRALLALSETGSLSNAAKRVYLTQSALSHQILNLEEHYGTPFFERKSQPIRFTATGQRLVNLAREVLEQVANAERDLAKIRLGNAGSLRVAVECHTCFDWLMPAMDVFRENWPEVELDLVSGFHSDPLTLLEEQRADLVIVSEQYDRKNIHYFPLFQFEMLGLMSKKHPLAHKHYLEATDFAQETLITYPVPTEMLDLIRYVLEPAGIHPQRRTTELTVAILQLVASGRGLAALPIWSIQSYLEKNYILGKSITKQGLWSKLYAATTTAFSPTPYLIDFIEMIRRKSCELFKIQLM